jgi:hypothetical protein
MESNAAFDPAVRLLVSSGWALRLSLPISFIFSDIRSFVLPGKFGLLAKYRSRPAGRYWATAPVPIHPGTQHSLLQPSPSIRCSRVLPPSALASHPSYTKQLQSSSENGLGQSHRSKAGGSLNLPTIPRTIQPDRTNSINAYLTQYTDW